MLRMEMRAEESPANRTQQVPPVFVLEYPTGDFRVYWFPKNGGEPVLATMAESPTTGADPHEVDIDP